MPRRAALYRYRIPLEPQPLCAGQRLAARDGLVVQLQQGEHCGYGEVAPLPGFSPETLQQAQRELLQTLPLWVAGQPITVDSPSVAFGLSCAVDEVAGAHSTPAHCGSPLQGYPLLSGTPTQIIERWQQWQGARPSLAKLKLGRYPIAAEQQMVHALLRISPTLKLRIDANRSWTLPQAREWAQWIGVEAIDYLEEPCQQLGQSLQLAEEYGVGIALDESLRDRHFVLPPSRHIRALVLKPSLTGSIAQLEKQIDTATRRGITCILSSSYESSLGIGQLQALAARLTPDSAPGLDTLGCFASNLLRGGDPAKPTLSLEQLEPLWQS
ncbi:o-succinylbenzoate synthase [Aestuariirhabdus sp. LZHN29]|uniref:o-succinylbenzoate synthase n=1 Tax=Aestuariirhabdus sp. LZHN29 TaxID=3417462 RepID=UPI003CFB2906